MVACSKGIPLTPQLKQTEITTGLRGSILNPRSRRLRTHTRIDTGFLSAPIPL